ncbi:hypothetical protein [Yimella sp. cx-51]|uniref:hypothetical protein n=1 Tax=Yimella sp. cx-51 TaxID=2770551 RepID=UPI00165DD0F8|nr:hypothetical protein [Yimella sp. cx-51]MBC9957782.1 hypothetical protein [Yimella sp. cx-51]QTH36875.1 hypothetical protein J5M86_07930 [Yimella sp. cx-51]
MTTIKAPINTDPDQLRRGVTRRNLTRGVAWAAPTIAFGAHVAAHAASGYQVWFKPLGVACKTPGASCEKPTGITKGYVVRVQVCHNIPYDTEITIRDATVSLGGGPFSLWQVKAVQGSVNCTGTTIGTISDPEGEVADVVLKMPAATATADACCVIDFGIEGEPNSSNVSIAGTAPYSWYIPSQGISSPTPDPLLGLTASATPPCKDCKIVDVQPIPSTSTAPAPSAKSSSSITQAPTSTAVPTSTASPAPTSTQASVSTTGSGESASSNG